LEKQMLAILGLVLGVVLALVFRPEMPLWLQPYLPIMIVAALDALVGAARAWLEKTFSDRVFAVSFVSNVAVAALIVLLGDLIGVGSQLSTAVLVVLGIRIFTNAAVIRRKVLHA
jgi:small basic protein